MTAEDLSGVVLVGGIPDPIPLADRAAVHSAWRSALAEPDPGAVVAMGAARMALRK